MGNIWKTSIENLVKLEKKAEFLPSLFNAPDNHFQFENGGDDKQLAVNNDPISDDETLYGEWWQDKPRNPDTWRAFISMFSKPISKKDEMTVDSAYDPEMEEAESKEMGEEPLIEYQKGFYDPKKHDFPHNTTWDSLTQDGEPSKPTSVTYSPQTNEDNLDQNSPGGYPRRFMGKPKGEWSSTDGEIIPALENMLKNKEAAINSLTRDVTSAIELTEKGYWVDPSGKFYDVREGGGWNTHGAWTYTHREELTKQYPDFNAEQGLYFLLEHGWIRIGDSYGADYGIEAVDPSHLPSSVIDWVNGNLKNVKIENYATRKNVVINLPVDDLQETINNEFRLQKLAPVTASVHGYGGWINPSGEVLLAEDHGDVILENPDFFGITNPIDKKIIIWSKLYIALYNEGFVRFRVWSDDLWFETNTLDSLKVAENTIFKLLPDIKKITVNANDGAYTATVEEFKEKGFDAFSKQVPVMAKKAELIDFQAPNGFTFPVLFNPSKQEFLGAINKYGIVRILKSESGIYVWDANEMTHLDMVKALRALGYEDAENYFPKKGYTSKSVGDKVTVEDMNGHWADISIDELLSNQLVMAKQAGSYSSTYTDEQGEQFFNEQHQNDEDQIPYTNFDQRDVSYGYHDSPENTDSGIGWNKDETTSVCLLDQLQNPADRNYPPGMPDYSIVFYEAMPSSDGIEATNPD